MPKRQATLRADGRWVISVYIGTDRKTGKKIEKSVYGATQKECKQKADALRLKYSKGLDISAERETFAVWADRWLEMKMVSTSQRRAYQSFLNHLTPAIGDLEVSRIRAVDIQQVANSLTRQGLSQKTVASIVQAASQVLQLCVDNRVIEYNPCSAVKIPKGKASEKREPLTEEQIRWVWDTEHRARVPALIMLYCGLRRGELMALQWSAVDLKQATISIRQSASFDQSGAFSVKEGGKTDSAVREVHIPPILMPVLEKQRKSAENPFGGFVCTNASGGMLTPSSWKVMWESYMTELNLKYGYGYSESKYNPAGLPMRIKPFTAHQLRHTYTTMLLEAGVSEVTAQHLLGHANLTTTLNIYTHLREGQEKADLEKIDAYLTPKIG